MADYSNRVQIEGNIGINSYKKSPKQPDMTGKVVVNRAFLRSLVEEVKAGVEPTVRIAVWNREGREPPAEKEEPVVEEPTQDDFNDDIPF